MSRLGVYVHLPWCVRKCPYCDFNSHPLTGDVPARDYIHALLNDLNQWAGLATGRRVNSVYFGGGTPSLFSGDQIGEIVEGIAARLPLADEAEITLEANPGTVERDAFTAYRDAGVNRVSLGVQSFDEQALARLGRIHGRGDIERSVDSLHRAGITNFNLDLMYGLPGQGAAESQEDIRLALDTDPAHVSYYHLTLEPNTAFAHDPPELPDEDACWDMQEAGGARLESGGLEQYEVSAWSKPGRRCGHNLNYWRYGDFIGIGAGAHGKLTRPGDEGVMRWSMPRQPRVYLADQSPAGQRVLAPESLIFEFFLNRLRLREPFSARDFSARTGLPWDTVSDRVRQAIERGLVDALGAEFTTSELGWRFLNDTQQIFLP
jgi:oxygen-independent coproporphyrinogen-3 oxidase